MVLRVLKLIAVVAAASVILFEEWLWDPLHRLMAMISRLPVLRSLAGIIAKLSPRAAMIVYLVPVVVLFPFKIAGLWLIGHGHAVTGLSTFLAAKIIGTALFAWLFSLTRNALLQIAWFARAYAAIQQISEAAHAWLHQLAFYGWMRMFARHIRAAIRQLFASGK